MATAPQRSQDRPRIMNEVSHRSRTRRAASKARRAAAKASGAKSSRRAVANSMRTTIADLIESGARRLDRARVFYGHGTDNSRDEAAALVWHALALPAE